MHECESPERLTDSLSVAIRRHAKHLGVVRLSPSEFVGCRGGFAFIRRSRDEGVFGDNDGFILHLQMAETPALREAPARYMNVVQSTQRDGPLLEYQWCLKSASQRHVKLEFLRLLSESKKTFRMEIRSIPCLITASNRNLNDDIGLVIDKPTFFKHAARMWWDGKAR